MPLPLIFILGELISNPFNLALASKFGIFKFGSFISNSPEGPFISGLSILIFPDILESGILTSILEEGFVPWIIPVIFSKIPFFSIFIFGVLVSGNFKPTFNLGSLIFCPLIFPFTSKLFFNWGAFKSTA